MLFRSRLKPKATKQPLQISDAVVDRDGVVWAFEGVWGTLYRLAGDRLVQVAQLPPPNWVASNLLADTHGRL